MRRALDVLCRIRDGIRAALGDDAYDAYRRSSKRRGVEPRLSRSEFYQDVLMRRFDSINRCC